MLTGPLNQEDFQNKIDELFQTAQAQSLPEIYIKAGDLHRLVGVYPLKNHQMANCCRIMRNNMKPDDQILFAPPKGDGASLLIKYKLPR